MRPDPTGFLNLAKPAGLTSHDCVATVRRLLHTRKVGHAGTLDPAATGVLPLAVGRATRFLSFLSGQKAYRATFRFGQASSTDDLEGELLRSDPCAWLSLDQIQAFLPQFVGTISQIPPLYSAVRKDGKHLYELARSGVKADELDIAPRQVTIHALRILDWRGGDFPELDLDIDCGSGTYIRSIARDLGQSLNCGGLMSHLIRLQSGPFQLAESILLADLAQASDPATALLPIEVAFQNLPQIELDLEQVQRWQQGQRLNPITNSTDPGLVRVWHAEKQVFLGLGAWEAETLTAVRVLPMDPNPVG